MEEIRLHVENEYGKLESVLVNAGGSVMDSGQAEELEKEFGNERGDELNDHPETAPYKADLIRSQHKNFLALLKKKGAELYFAEDIPKASDQIFTRDLGVVIGDTFYEGRLNDRIRQLEHQGLDKLRDRFTNYCQLEEGIVECGDVFVHNKKVFVGITRKSTNMEGFLGLKKILEPKGYWCIPIRCAPEVLHLDCRFGILSRGEALIYRPGIHPQDLLILERTFNLIDLDADLVRTLGSNLTMVSRNEVILDKRNTKIKDLLEQKGFLVHAIEYSEITKKWGAFRCTTLPLYRS